jgi:hypothetical protein
VGEEAIWTRLLNSSLLVEHGGNAERIAAELRAVPAVVGATAPRTWRQGSDALVEAFPAIEDRLPASRRSSIGSTNG